MIQGRLREHVGPAPAIVGASLLFGSLHLARSLLAKGLRDHVQQVRQVED